MKITQEHGSLSEARGGKAEAIVIGVDPDCDKSGVALWDGELALANMRFFDLYLMLKAFQLEQVSVRVFIEAGWLNSGHFHLHPKDTLKSAAQKGNGVGRNHETGRKISEMCEFLKIDYELVKPERSKLDSAAFKRIYKYEKRTNQEQRDAAALIAKFI